MLSPLFLASFIIGKKLLLDDEEFCKLYGYLVNNLKEDAKSVFYHVLFLVRRLSIVASTNLLNSSPYAQTIICSVSSWVVMYI